MMWPTDIMKEVDRMRRDMNILFSRAPLYGDGSYQYPLINLYDSKNEFTLIAEIPGIDKNTLEIHFHNGILTLSGKRELKRFGKSEELRLEQPEGSFEKNIRIPLKVKDNEIKAKFEDGILKLTIPKAEEAKPRQIVIES
jgi:HSP20 family protein